MGLVNYLRATGSYYSARFHKGEEGAVATEYGFLVVMIAIAVAIGAVVLGQGLLNLFNDTGVKVDAVPVSQVPNPPTVAN